MHSLSQEPCIAVDTESNSRHKYPERVCLVQLATAKGVYLIDTLAVEEMKPLGEILADESVVKVIHGADYDIRSLDRQWGFRVRNLFDTSVAARFVGIEKYGLSALIEELLGIQIPKSASMQKSDWSHRPLQQRALDYAAADVWYLLSIQRALERRLRTLKRDRWVAEECSRLEEVRYIASDPETAFLSLKGSHKLDGKQRAVLKRLFLLREAEARRRNRPPYYVLPHETLVYLACNPTADLSLMPSLRRQVDTPFGRLLRTALREGVADPPVPRLTRYQPQPAIPIDAELLKRLKRWRIDQGMALSIDASLVWPVASLERLAKARHSLGVEIESPEVRRWQREQFAESLSAALL